MAPVDFKSQTLTFLFLPLHGLNYHCGGRLNGTLQLQTSRSLYLFIFTKEVQTCHKKCNLFITDTKNTFRADLIQIGIITSKVNCQYY